MGNSMRPIHPGEILREEMAELNLSARQLAASLRVPTNRVTGVLNEQRAITADTALRLARYFGTTPEFWMNLQTAYELRCARSDHGDKICRDVQPHYDSLQGAADRSASVDDDLAEALAAARR